MTNYNERLDKILGIFSGGITGKGSDRGGYPTYFTEPYPIWCEARKSEAKQAILDWHNKQVEEVLDRLEKEQYGMYDDYHDLVDIVPMSAIQAERAKLREV